MDDEKKAREALAREVLDALAADEPVGEVARVAGFDREWVRRARVAEEKRLAEEAKSSKRPGWDDEDEEEAALFRPRG
ncbi:hypothetical protein AB0J28_00515 [Streptosporangium canum]|uniref:hypothetical protein n=1 Tax=Streptosporangium canum TaxID=324952 RepID=UPI0034264404